MCIQDAKGKPVPRAGNIGHGADPVETTKVIEFNDIAALEAALRDESIACVLAEPVMTNIGIIHPTPGYHDALRALTRKYGSLLVIDETHTICAGPGGYTALHGLEPDFFVIGKPIGRSLCMIRKVLDSFFKFIGVLVLYLAAFPLLRTA